jgi:hypothetical protein
MNTNVRISPTQQSAFGLIGEQQLVAHDSRITAPEPLNLSSEERLVFLRKIDRWRPWGSLNEKRFCLGCGRIITGHDIRIVDEPGPLGLRCPTEACRSLPIDWVLLNDAQRAAQL